jgi:hypothetical protein
MHIFNHKHIYLGDADKHENMQMRVFHESLPVIVAHCNGYRAVCPTCRQEVEVAFYSDVPCHSDLCEHVYYGLNKEHFNIDYPYQGYGSNNSPPLFWMVKQEKRAYKPTRWVSGLGI